MIGTGVAAMALLGAGCGSAPATTTPTPPSTVEAPAEQPAVANAVTIQDYAYGPAKLVVKKGTTVTWTNKDVAKHTVTGKNGGPKSELFGQNETYSYTFDTVGTFDYFCEPHPYMKASVQVTE